MKIRIRGNSIRIRLMQGEVKRLLEEGIVTEIVQFPGNETFTYSLSISPSFNVKFQGNHMHVSVPKKETDAWIKSTEDLTISHLFELENGDSLRLMVEKDLACLTARQGEDDSDAFPNPKKEC